MRFETIPFYKELHGSAYFYLQLPGRIVFDYKQLSYKKLSATVKVSCYIYPRLQHNSGGKLVHSY
jgi:hypothetical protein